MLAVALTILAALTASNPGAGGPGSDRSAAPPPPILVSNARIWTPRQVRDGEWMNSLDGRIGAVATGPIPPTIPNPKRLHIDAGGRRVLPGLIDTHVHLGNAAADLRRINLRDAKSREELLDTLRAASRDMRPDEWVIGSRWSSESWPDQRPPNAEEIGDAVGGRRAVLIRMDGHMLLASRAALAGAGIGKDGPPDPPGGKIGRLPSGEPDGAVYEQAMGMIERLVPEPTRAERVALLRKAIAAANGAGVTQVGAIETRETLELLAEMDRDEPLTLRIQATIWDGDASTVDEWLPTLEWAAANKQLSPNIRVIGFKAYMDGSLGSRTAWQSAPYLDDPHDPGNDGMPLAMAGDGTLRDLIARGAAMGLQPAVHAIGDRANHMLLDWYEEALTPEQRTALRPRVEHAQHLLPEDIVRFARLNVVPSMQPYHKADDGRYAEQRLGAARCESSYAFRALVDAKAMLAFGSDWPVVDVNPFLGVAAAVNARTLDGKTFVPGQSIGVEEALLRYTIIAAWALHAERGSGSLREEAPADFVIVEPDPFTTSPDRLGEVRVRMTVVGGRVVYDAAAPAGAPVTPAPAPR